MSIMTKGTEKELRERFTVYKHLAELKPHIRDSFRELLYIVYNRYVQLLEYGKEEKLHDYRLILRFITYLKGEVEDAAQRVEKINNIFEEAESIGMLGRWMGELGLRKGETPMDVLNRLKFHTEEAFDYRDKFMEE